MKLLVFVLCFMATVSADQWCNYTTGGGESIFEAFPIKGFATSGAAEIRQNWCITGCQQRSSIKAAMLFQAAAKNQTAVEKLTISKVPTVNGPATYHNRKLVNPDDSSKFQFCTDPVVQAAVNSAFAMWDYPDAIADDLNRNINRPGWAYLVVQLADIPNEVTLQGLYTDPDFCYVFVKKRNAANEEEEYGLYSGLVHV